MTGRWLLVEGLPRVVTTFFARSLTGLRARPNLEGMELRDRLRAEFARRVERNPRYSQRAFARSLSLHHTTLTRVLDGRRGLSASMLSRVCARLGCSAADVRAARLAEDARKVLLLASAPDFRPDCRWIAVKSGVDLDNVSRALHLLIHKRQLVMSSPTKWTVKA